MTLEDYLKEKYPTMTTSQADAAFAAKVGTTRQAIQRYRTFKRWLQPPMIYAIAVESRGLVMADDHLPPQFRYRARRARA